MNRIRFICAFFILLVKILSADAQVNLIVKSLPNTTPQEDTIFISGTFNEWKVNDQEFMLRKQLDGKYSITLNSDTGFIEFKFTRGSWLKVETDKNNEYISNRFFEFDSEEIIYIDIENWLDLGGAKQFNYIVFILFAFALIGIILILFVSLIRSKKRYLYRNFLILNIFITTVLIASIIYNQSNLIWQSKIYMLGYVMLFLWGPFLYYFICSVRYNSLGRKLLQNLIPGFIVSLWAILSLLNFKPLSFQIKEVFPQMSLGSFIVISFGILLNVFYHIRILRNFKKDKTAEISQTRITLSLYIFLLSSIALLFLIIDFFASFIWPKLNIDNKFEIVILFISIIILVEFKYFWKYPQIIQVTDSLHSKIKSKKVNIRKKKLLSEFISEEHQGLDEYEMKLAKKLFTCMKEKKPYRDPDLTVSKLSELLETKAHILSKILNDELNLNFRDFINNYRIKEFVEIADSKEFKNFTLLALAFEVGFNSKSTFNLAFKKITGLTPGKYLEKKREEEQ